MEKLHEREAESKEKKRLNFNHRHNAAPLKALQPGIPVHIKDMGTTGTVIGAAETPRSYMIETEKGTVRRNRSHVIPIPINKSMSPSVTKQQPQDKALFPLPAFFSSFCCATSVSLVFLNSCPSMHDDCGIALLS